MTLRKLLKICDKKLIQVIICFEDDKYGDEDNTLVFDSFEEEHYQKYLDNKLSEIQPIISYKNHKPNKAIFRVFIDIPKGEE